MNEALESTLNSALIGILETAVEAKEFLVAEVPEVVQQLLVWKSAESAIGIIMYIGFVVFATVLMRKFIKGINIEYVEEGYDDKRTFNNLSDSKQIEIIAYGVVGGITAFICLIGSFDSFLPNLKTIVQIQVAPKLYLIEYIAEMVK